MLPSVEIKSQIIIDSEVAHKLSESFIFLTGAAGSGKTTAIREISRIDPSYIELCSTTGIAAINLGGKTINSTLKYFNTQSLRQAHEKNLLHKNLRLIRNKKKVLGIEEVSMMEAEQLDLICDAVDNINDDLTGKKLGIHLIGDLAQLPPVSPGNASPPFIFKANCWDRFEKNTIKLDKIYRQDNPEFIAAINLVRIGKGFEAVPALQKCGVRFVDVLDNDFNGTTIMPTNAQVDAFNQHKLGQIAAPMIRTSPTKRGKQAGEWEKNIPYELRLKEGAYVMILSNDSPEFTYVNGDCGIIVGFDKGTEVFHVKLKRNENVVKIGRVLRNNLSSTAPYPTDYSSMWSPVVDNLTGDWVMGNIKYHPLRLAYSSTVHKVQGLSLDAIQVDTRHTFFGSPNMAYVSVSRARTPEGLVIIGSPNEVVKKIKVSEEVKKYI